MYTILDGKVVSNYIKDGVRDSVHTMNNKGIDVCLAVILVGKDPASEIYVANKKKACESVGIISKEYILDANTSEAELIDLIKKLNDDITINGILCQLPLPKSISERNVINAINPYKDVDAFHPVNVGKIMIGDYNFLPCTPAGIMQLLKYYNIDVSGKSCAVIGRSNIVGKPMALLMLHSDATVTVCHSKTSDLKEIVKNADIVVSAVGKPKFVTADMIKDGAVVIDVGIVRTEGKICGDVDFENVKDKVSAITPVPGGVGPMTIAMLLKNTVTAAIIQNNAEGLI